MSRKKRTTKGEKRPCGTREPQDISNAKKSGGKTVERRKRKREAIFTPTMGRGRGTNGN